MVATMMTRQKAKAVKPKADAIIHAVAMMNVYAAATKKAKN